MPLTSQKRLREQSGGPASPKSAIPNKKVCQMQSSGDHRQQPQVSEVPPPVRYLSPDILVEDAEGHLVYNPNDILCVCEPSGAVRHRFELLGTLGEGTFGRVVCVNDLDQKAKFALKIVRKVEKYAHAALLEINVLEELHKLDPLGKKLCVKMVDHFNYHGHECILFELLGRSVFDVLKENGYHPFPVDQIRFIAFQLIYAVKFLHDNQMTHTDLKPENILFVSSEYHRVPPTVLTSRKTPKQEILEIRNAKIRLIDFGSTVFDCDHHGVTISTRHYRAPEVILELGWGQPCDVWSIGCILFELYTGDTLFQTHDNREHLAIMERTLGELPTVLTGTSTECHAASSSFYPHYALGADRKKRRSAACINAHFKPLEDYMRLKDDETVALFDLIGRMLEFNPSQRITLAEGKRHPFFLRHQPTVKVSTIKSCDEKVASLRTGRPRLHNQD